MVRATIGIPLDRHERAAQVRAACRDRSLPLRNACQIVQSRTTSRGGHQAAIVVGPSCRLRSVAVRRPRRNRPEGRVPTSRRVDLRETLVGSLEPTGISVPAATSDAGSGRSDGPRRVTRRRAAQRKRKAHFGVPSSTAETHSGRSGGIGPASIAVPGPEETRLPRPLAESPASGRGKSRA